MLKLWCSPCCDEPNSRPTVGTVLLGATTRGAYLDLGAVLPSRVGDHAHRSLRGSGRRANTLFFALTRYSTYCTRILLIVHQICSLAASQRISSHACRLLSSASGDQYLIGKWGPTRAPQFVRAQAERIAQHSMRHVHIPPAEARFCRIQATFCAVNGHSLAN